MKNTKKALIGLCLIAGAFATSAAAFAEAGSGHSGGGSGVICFSSVQTKLQVQKVLRENQTNINSPNDPFTDDVLSKITSVELLDLAEAKVPSIVDQYGGEAGPYQEIASSLTPQELIKDRMAILQQRGAAFALRNLDDLQWTLPLDRFNLQSSGVVQINDTESKVIPKNECLIAQIAVQSFIGSSLLKKVDIDGRLYAKMDNINQAALIFHEWIYKIGIDRGQTDSSAARQVVADIFSTLFENWMAWTNRLYNLGFTDLAPVYMSFKLPTIVDPNAFASIQKVDKAPIPIDYNSGQFAIGVVLWGAVTNDSSHVTAGGLMVSAVDFKAGDYVTQVDSKSMTVILKGGRPMNLNDHKFSIFKIALSPEKISVCPMADLDWNGIPIKADGDWACIEDGKALVFGNNKNLPKEFTTSKDFAYQGTAISANSRVVLNDDGSIASVTKHE